ncbi:MULTISPECIES: S53 family peptidase [Ramlibacter]|uniref:S53 family peptidase n=1 Tax=Ramlibacter aquaticus TaxID=2780094 RepID=A0ABR9SDE0_9BURK|nr:MULTISPECIES: S53 family peptidase [Ramlibacter]MBE7940373.1 S53 family peptidase [Ramlibacter aquaticus]
MRPRLSPSVASLALMLALSSCGGGGGGGSPGPVNASASATPATGVDTLPAAAPELLFEQAAALAQGQPFELPAPPQEQGTSTQAVEFAMAAPLSRVLALDGAPLNGPRAVLAVAATGTAPAYFTPPQLRQAYGLDSVAAASPADLGADAGARLGAGQTVYVIVATHDPATLSMLNASASQFGLPGCSATSISYTSALPLAPASTTGCSFAVVGATSGGGFGPVSASVDRRWAVEEQLDVQMVHAMAPLARIVVVVSPTAYGSDLAGAIQLASRMGPGTVSMSFGAPDSSGWALYDGVFGGEGMLFVAAAGDSGFNGGTVSWPAAHPNVLAAGGTSLKLVDGVRTETAWSSAGGAASAWRDAPAYQAGYSMTRPARRQVPDVSADADPATAMMVYADAGTGPSWYLVGGTSAVAPLWAGLLADANARRQLAGKAVLAGTAVHTALYQSIARFSMSYGAGFDDVTSGSNGDCFTCSARPGYDLATGLGTPRAGSLLQSLATY